MKNLYTPVLSLTFLLFSLTLKAQEKAENSLMFFSIQGKVYDAVTKKGIVDASVKLKGSDGSTYEMRTNKKGLYSFDEKVTKGERYVLPNMRYTIIVNALGYEESQQDEDTAEAEESTTFQVDFALQKVK